MFEKVPSSPDLVAGEHEVLKFWHEQQIFERLRAKNAGRAKWSFLDGPITANNPMGVHHAWGRTLKDVFQRYFAMTGHDQRYQNGFDCQGLWVEVEVEKELGIRSKRDIEALVPGDRFASIDRFVTACKDRVNKFARRQTEQSIRLGMWMDWDRDEDWQRPPDQRRSYFTMSEANNFTIWSFLKKCHARGLVYKAYDSMPWCPRCAVGISQMEMHEGYQLVAHRAVFVRFPLRKEGSRQLAVGSREEADLPESLLVWTTTPWTLSSNVGAAVNPALTYVKVKHRDQIYYLAKGALTANRLEEQFKKKDEWIEGVPKLKSVAQIFKEKGGYEVLAELPGSELVGWTYDGPFDELPAQSEPFGSPARIATVVEKQGWSPRVSAKDAHRVIAWDMVGETEGTGIVHIAPGCGAEDFELGKHEGLPPIAPLDDEGVFLPNFGPLAGKSAVADDTVDFILDNLTQKGLLVAVEKYPHNFPHCWRCKTELLFRLVDEWYIAMGREDDPASYRRQIMAACEQVERWIPSYGLERELDWLRNMGDWMISKKRYWGLALPIWVCDACGAFDVIGSRDELESRATAGLDKFAGHSPHRPWVDVVELACPTHAASGCAGRARRIADVGNPWLDAGIVPYSTLRYHADRDYWREWFPPHLICESLPGQFRNWFYAILAMSTMMENRAPFRALIGHALVRDEHGDEMHKSAGNAIWFDDAAEKMGVDVMRWLYCRQNPTQNLNFGYGPGREVERQVFNTLWNCYAFFVNYARLDEFDPASPPVPPADRPEIDRWILSNLQLLIHTTRTRFEAFDASGVIRAAEDFIEELSNWYIRRSRPRFWRSRNENDRDKLAAYQTLYEVLLTLCKLLAPIIPFLAERIFRNLRCDSAGQPDSVHHCEFPTPVRELADPDLSYLMSLVRRLVAGGHAVREKAAQRVRQPLVQFVAEVAEQTERDALEPMKSLIAEELNVKQVRFVADLDGVTVVDYVAKPNFKQLGPRFGKDAKVIAASILNLPRDQVIQLYSGHPVRLQLADTFFELMPEDVIVERQTKPGWHQDEGTAFSSKLTVESLTRIRFNIEPPNPVQTRWKVGSTDRLRWSIDANVDDELRREGLAQDVKRNIQQLRKELDLNIEDRIEVIYFTDDAELKQAIEEWKSYLMNETLCVSFEFGTPGPGAKEVQLGTKKLVIEVRKCVA